MRPSLKRLNIFFIVASGAIFTACAHTPTENTGCRSPAGSPDIVQCDKVLSGAYHSHDIGIDLNSGKKLEEQNNLYHERFFNNISPADEKGDHFWGAIIASPTGSYFFDWLRDSGLSMRIVVRLYKATRPGPVRSFYLKLIRAFVSFNLKRQDTPNFSGSGVIVPETDPEKAKTDPFKSVFEGYGEPKEDVDGTPFNESWGRPQRDGPAARAIAMLPFAQALLDGGDPDLVKYVKTVLYDSKYPTASKSLIKRDLEYILHNWRKSSFDVWEEVSGFHFFTLMVQRRALVEGAALAERLGDKGAADEYIKAAAEMGPELDQFWDPQRKFILATRNFERGIEKGGLDVAVVLGSLYGSTPDRAMPVSKKTVPGAFRCSDDRVLASVVAVEADSKARHIVNHAQNGVEPKAVLIERYPEDTYDGFDRSGGNPWVLTTLGFAEHAYRVADELLLSGNVLINDLNRVFYEQVLPGEKLENGQIIKKDDPLFNKLILGLVNRGDNIIERVNEFKSPNSELSEQIFHGATQAGPEAQRGVSNLTWNYVAFDRATEAYRKLMIDFGHWFNDNTH
jgi:glucoamylase